MMKRGDSLKLSLAADMEYLNFAVTFIRETAKLIGFGEGEIHKIELAAEEAISNVIEHAFASERGVFDITCERTPLGIKIKIKDKGIPFDPSHIQPYNPDAGDLESASATGLGLHIIKESMDEVFFNNLGMEGKETHLIKYLPAMKIERYFDKEELEFEKQQPEKSAKRENVHFTVRRMMPHEAIEVSRCAYKSHGYTFFADHIYYPERLVELNATEDMISVVAVTDKGTFMGHSALVYNQPAAPIAELNFAFVNPEYRGQGCLARIVEYLFNCPKKNPLRGVYANSVTNHEFSQREAVKFGVYDCALLLATSPQTWIFKGISDVNPQRISMALGFKYIEETPSPLTIYAPPHHLEMIKKLYTHIKAPQHVFTAPADRVPKFLESKAQIMTEIFTTENCAEIGIVSYGADVLIELRKILREFCLKDIAAIQLAVNLEDPLTYLMTAEFEKMNFFFAGILPISPVGGDGLILQYLNNVDLDYEKITLHTSMAKELRDYIKKCDPNIYLGNNT
ncbi:MAG: ATP-binding protein [Deltaproteobacteria bacterium]